MLLHVLNRLKHEPRWWGRIALALLGIVGYGLTVAPTVSFWDCGEFIAAAHVVGIPHPPGTPFFVILGRAWELMLSFAGPVAFRINLLSAASSLLGVLVVQEITFEVLRHFRIPSLARAALAFLAGSLVAFSDTYWFNAVEAEVYGVSMAMLLLSVWSVLRWDRAPEEARSRWLALFVYLSFLGMGVHTNAMLAFIPGWLFIGLRSGYCVPRKWVWALLGWAGLVLGVLLWNPVLYGQSSFLLVALTGFLVGLFLAVRHRELSQAPYWLLGAFLFSAVFLTGPFLVGLLVALFLSGTGFLLWRGGRQLPGLGIGTVFLLLLMAAMGYSTHLVLPVRSSTNPILDENNPESWQEVRDALERKQYGSMGMLERALWRRAAWENQFGFSERIGYLGYHLNQWAPAPLGAQEPLQWGQSSQGLAGVLHMAHRIVGELVLVLVLVAVVSLVRKPTVAFLAGMFFVASLGLLFYVNFSDGSRPDSRDASSWHKRIAELQDSLRGESLPRLPSLAQMGESIQEYRSTGKVTESIHNLMSWEKAASRKGMHLPLPPRNVHREVRERDYFYTPAFALFPVLFALALAFLWESRNRVWLGRVILGLSAVAWTLPFFTHFQMHDRSQDWVAHSFARNILSSVPPHGILVTYGDNDTFPLWYMQMVEEFRTDVLVINASLVQMDWYQEQMLRERPDLTVSTTVEQRVSRAYQPQPSPRFSLGGSPLFFAGDSLWRPGPGDQLLAEIVAWNWPRVPMCYMYNANPSELPGGPEIGAQIAPIAGLVRVLGMPVETADSLLVHRMASGYSFQGFETPNWHFQESTVRTAVGYRYLFRSAESLTNHAETRSKISKRAQPLQ